jgi:hypothetical protein
MHPRSRPQALSRDTRRIDSLCIFCKNNAKIVRDSLGEVWYIIRSLFWGLRNAKAVNF